jgi:hypothetical protein
MAYQSCCGEVFDALIAYLIEIAGKKTSGS